MKQRTLILAFLLLGIATSAQTIHLCEGDSLQEYSVSPSDTSSFMYWDFIIGSGAQFVGVQNTEQTRINFPVAGTYVLQFSETNQYGCVGAVIIDIVVHSLPTPSFSYFPLCENQLASFENTSTADGSIQTTRWSIGGYIDTSYHADFMFYDQGSYPISLYVEDEWGCVNSYSEIVQVNPLPQADFYFTPLDPSTLNPEVQFENLSTIGTVYDWSFGDDNFSTEESPFHVYNRAGWYDIQLKVEDDNGCQDSIQKPLLVKSDLLFYVPDAFTPNSDGDNDMFGPEGFQMDRWQSYHLKVWSPWGELIFESTEVNQLWDGKTKSGLYAANDTYVWSIRINDELGKQTHHTGTVNLLR